jgi:uncharacterized membrane protein YdjX (TVP38/TMEM64 family)
VFLRNMASDVLLASVRLGTACLSAREHFALFVVCLKVTLHVLRIPAPKLAVGTSVGILFGYIVGILVMSTAASVGDRSAWFGSRTGRTHFTPDLVAKFASQEGDEHT